MTIKKCYEKLNELYTISKQRKLTIKEQLLYCNIKIFINKNH